MARSLRRTLESMATPSSVKTYGRYLGCLPRREPVVVAASSKVTICDLKSLVSSQVNWNMKSAGNRWRLRRTAWLRTLVGTSYNRA